MAIKIGICFSKDLVGENPLDHVGTKLPVYLRLLDMIRDAGWEAYVLTRLTYKGKGVFEGAWKYENGKFKIINGKTKIDLIYDRSGGISFPFKDEKTPVVNRSDFKTLCWDKMATYKKIGKFMPVSILLNRESEIPQILPKLKTDLVVLKPFNGLKGTGVFIGSKDKALKFKFHEMYRKYIAQEFVDTKGGIVGITPGRHDLRVVVVNGQVVWCHVRVPPLGTYLANAAQGGNLREVDYKKVPQTIKKIVKEISEMFNREYDSPIFSLDFGVGDNGKPYIFEINDQIGFPKWDMKNRDRFLNSLIANFAVKLTKKD